MELAQEVGIEPDPLLDRRNNQPTRAEIFNKPREDNRGRTMLQGTIKPDRHHRLDLKEVPRVMDGNQQVVKKNVLENVITDIEVNPISLLVLTPMRKMKSRSYKKMKIYER